MHGRVHPNDATPARALGRKATKRARLLSYSPSKPCFFKAAATDPPAMPMMS
jgi:ribosomal protein S15P/S13E